MIVATKVVSQPFLPLPWPTSQCLPGDKSQITFKLTDFWRLTKSFMQTFLFLLNAKFFSERCYDNFFSQKLNSFSLKVYWCLNKLMPGIKFVRLRTFSFINFPYFYLSECTCQKPFTSKSNRTLKICRFKFYHGFFFPLSLSSIIQNLGCKKALVFILNDIHLGTAFSVHNFF